MSVELSMLLWVALLTFVQMMIAVQGATSQVGLGTLAGNRENLPAMEGWRGRADRAYRNMLESLPLFAIFVLAGAAAGVSDDLTVIGAQLFLYARIAYALVYLIGMPWVRTGIWSVAVVGMALVAIPLFSAIGG